MRGHEENYSYLCAALRARAARFYTWEELSALARGGFESLKSEFLEGRYSESYRSQLLSSLSSPLRKIELAIMFEITRRLRSAHLKAQGEPRELMSVVLSQADLHNFRIILRRFASKGSHQEQEYLWHLYGDLPRKFFKNLWESDSITMARERIYLFGNPRGAILDSALAVLQTSKNLILAERELILNYIGYYETSISRFPNKNGAIVKEYLGRLVDLWNLNLWLKKRIGAEESRSSADYLPGGAWINPKDLSNAKVITDVIRWTPWYKAVRTKTFNSTMEFQWHIQREFWRWQISLFRKDPLGFEVPFGYIAKALAEWSNLNIIAIGTAFRLNPDKIIGRLIPIK